MLGNCSLRIHQLVIVVFLNSNLTDLYWENDKSHTDMNENMPARHSLENCKNDLKQYISYSKPQHQDVLISATAHPQLQDIPPSLPPFPHKPDRFALLGMSRSFRSLVAQLLASFQSYSRGSSAMLRPWETATDFISYLSLNVSIAFWASPCEPNSMKAHSDSTHESWT